MLKRQVIFNLEGKPQPRSGAKPRRSLCDTFVKCAVKIFRRTEGDNEAPWISEGEPLGLASNVAKEVLKVLQVIKVNEIINDIQLREYRHKQTLERTSIRFVAEDEVFERFPAKAHECR